MATIQELLRRKVAAAEKSFARRQELKQIDADIKRRQAIEDAQLSGESNGNTQPDGDT